MDKISFISDSEEKIQDKGNLNFNSLDWFNIENYSDVRNYTRNELSMHLATRNISIYHNFKRDIENGANINYFLQTLHFFSSKKALTLGVMDCPDNDSAINEFNAINFLSILENIYKDESSLQGLKALLRLLDKDLFDFPEHFKSDDYDGVFDSEVFQNITWDKSDTFEDNIVEIDLMYSDDKIIEDFKIWLNQKREKHPSNKSNKSHKRISDTEFRKWITQPRLAYIDLYLWQLITGNTLTYPEIVKLLYPNDRSMTPDNFKKTIAEKTIKEFTSRIFDRRFM
jgi:hypothetical protein